MCVCVCVGIRVDVTWSVCVCVCVDAKFKTRLSLLPQKPYIFTEIVIIMDEPRCSHILEAFMHSFKFDTLESSWAEAWN